MVEGKHEESGPEARQKTRRSDPKKIDKSDALEIRKPDAKEMRKTDAKEIRNVESPNGGGRRTDGPRYRDREPLGRPKTADRGAKGQKREAFAERRTKTVEEEVERKPSGGERGRFYSTDDVEVGVQKFKGPGGGGAVKDLEHRREINGRDNYTRYDRSNGEKTRSSAEPQNGRFDHPDARNGRQDPRADRQNVRADRYDIQPDRQDGRYDRHDGPKMAGPPISDRSEPKHTDRFTSRYVWILDSYV